MELRPKVHVHGSETMAKQESHVSRPIILLFLLFFYRYINLNRGCKKYN